ncbi:TrkH family potassium uptake protein [Mycoplasma tauri]|uniref:TrkH family potassium uptake protein n=1 Tax=Mycoplasma tauri TaxID=547987 RepID=UPI0019683598|nr:TrkH family potassium uptake protein [Mycoplasma tauri]QSB07272.1 TrkH family potassium uptake protein [Mycoplasma tauri]
MKHNRFKDWWRNSKIIAFFRKIGLLSKKGTKIKLIFFVYLLIVLVASLFLYSPISHNAEYTKGNKITFVDSFFTISSAFSSTGLSIHSAYAAFNMFGQSIIAICILIGGLGIFALKIFLINVIFMRGRMSLNDVELISYERGNSDYFKNRSMIKDSMIFLIITLFIASCILTIYFYCFNPLSTQYLPKYVNYVESKGNVELSFRYGIFHAISALNNAGFDIIGDKSLLPYYKNIGLQIIFLLLFIIGGIGYPVIHDFASYIRAKIKNKKVKYKWSLFTKISLFTFFIVSLIGFIFVVSFEAASVKSESIIHNNGLFYSNEGYRVWSIFFMVMSTRSAGFSTIELNHMTEPSIWVLGILSFIGAAPASTGGGIRTTTCGILFLSIIAKSFGRPSVRAFKRRIDDETVKMSSVVATIAIILVIFATLISMSSFDYFSGKIDSKKYNSTHIFFEVLSAFGTTGLSTGITSDLNIATKITLSIIMFIGQFGISSSVLIWTNKKNYSYKYEYISEAVTIG